MGDRALLPLQLASGFLIPDVSALAQVSRALRTALEEDEGSWLPFYRQRFPCISDIDEDFRSPATARSFVKALLTARPPPRTGHLLRHPRPAVGRFTLPPCPQDTPRAQGDSAMLGVQVVIRGDDGHRRVLADRWLMFDERDVDEFEIYLYSHERDILAELGLPKSVEARFWPVEIGGGGFTVPGNLPAMIDSFCAAAARKIELEVYFIAQGCDQPSGDDDYIWRLHRAFEFDKGHVLEQLEECFAAPFRNMTEGGVEEEDPFIRLELYSEESLPLMEARLHLGTFMCLDGIDALAEFRGLVGRYELPYHNVFRLKMEMFRLEDYDDAGLFGLDKIDEEYVLFEEEAFCRLFATRRPVRFPRHQRQEERMQEWESQYTVKKLTGVV